MLKKCVFEKLTTNVTKTLLFSGAYSISLISLRIPQNNSNLLTGLESLISTRRLLIKQRDDEVFLCAPKNKFIIQNDWGENVRQMQILERFQLKTLQEITLFMIFILSRYTGQRKKVTVAHVIAWVLQGRSA